MNPDDEKLALWLDDELAGDDLAAMERACLEKPDLLAMREENRRWKEWMAMRLPAAEEPPYAEFFNSRIIRTIERQREEPSVAATHRHVGGSSWRAWFMPVAAAAGVVMGFQLGARHKAPQVADIDVSGAPRAIPVEPILYTPEKGVRASWFSSDGADAYVIVLDGVPPIPDDVDFTRAMSWQEDEEQHKGMVDFISPTETHAGGGS